MEGRNHDTHINTNGKGNSNTINCCRRIATGRGMFAAMTLSADGVRMGVGLWLRRESSAHIDFKNTAVEVK
jgi:hypothetical protein